MGRTTVLLSQVENPPQSAVLVVVDLCENLCQCWSLCVADVCETI